MERVRKERTATKRREQETLEVKSDGSKGTELTDTMDGILDEIDEVLELNAEEFVNSYVQKGGE